MVSGEIFILSDFQASAWNEVSLTPPSGIKLLTVPVATKMIGNLALASLRAEPAEPVLGQPLDLLARVRNFSAETASRGNFIYRRGKIGRPAVRKFHPGARRKSAPT